MRKRGQDSNVLQYVFIAVILLLMQFIAIKAYESVKEAACRSGEVVFGADVKTLGEGLGYGSVRLQEFSVPCGAEKVYFVETEKDEILNLLGGSLLIIDSIKDKTRENVFLTEESTLTSTFFAGGIEIGYPHYLCMKPRKGHVSVFVKNTGKGLLLTAGCDTTDCTEIPIRPGDAKARSVIHDFVEFACDGCPTDEAVEFNNYQQSKHNAEIYRRFSFCSKTGITKVEIIIKPKQKIEDFYFYEYLPKECINDLKDYLAKEIEGDVEIKDDPLIMWHFDKLAEETTVSYEIKKGLSDECKKLFEGLGLERITSPPACTSLCSSGEKNCVSTMSYRACGDYDADPCLEWGTPVNCAPGESCQDGVCKTLLPASPSAAATNSTPVPTPAPIPAPTPTPAPTPPPSCIDIDGDGFGNPASSSCTHPEQDCDDSTAFINPGASEVCGNSMDDNCDGVENEGCGGVCDTDGDGHDEFVWCAGGGPNDDCDDDDANKYPGNTETCDNKDNDCNSLVDEGLTTASGCNQIGYCAGAFKTCSAGLWGICSKTPQTEGCTDGLDNDCDGMADCADSDCSGEPACCVDTTWSPDPSTVCTGESFTQASNCGNTRTATGTKPCAASLSLGFSNVNYQYTGGNHYYYHTRTFTETNGVGVTLTSGQLCYQSLGTCNSATVSYRTEANGDYSWNDNFWTSVSSDKFTLTYWGTDDAGNPVTVSQSMTVAGSSYSVP